MKAWLSLITLKILSLNLCLDAKSKPCVRVCKMLCKVVCYTLQVPPAAIYSLWLRGGNNEQGILTSTWGSP